MNLRWSSRAVDDLLAIQRNIARDKPVAAKEWVKKLRLRAKKAALAPNAGRMVPEFGRDDLREVFLGSYRIVYRLRKEGITILTIFEGHRLLIENRSD